MFFDIRQNEESARNYTTTILKRKNEGISKMADNRVIIFDTTLRDGEQALPQSLSMRQKLQIALALEELGVDVIEAGFPNSSQGDFESVQTIAQTLKRSIPCGLSRAILKDVECAGEALKVAEHFRIHTFIATSSIHVKDKLRKSFDDVLAMGVAAVKCARQYTDDVEFSCEDAGRTPIDQLCRMVEEAIEAIKNGKMVLVTDDEDRENEGDLIMAAQFCTGDDVNFMAKYARGLICMPADPQIMDKLQFGAMVANNTDNHETAFSVSIDHVDTTTGISAYERAYTMRKCADPASQPQDFRRPEARLRSAQ